MNPATLFSLANVLPLPIWLIWLIAPRSSVSRQLVESLWPWQILAALYLIFICIAFSGAGAAPVAEGAAAPSFNSLAGVMAFFDSEWGALAGWVHYLCFDLFVARWIMGDAPGGGHRLAPVLFLTLMAGPVGLLLYLSARGFFRGSARGAASA
jgi:hypothetical protein